MELSVQRAAIVSAAVGFLLYLNSLGLGFCLDDEAAIIGNQDLLGNGSWVDLLKHDFWGKDISERDSHKSYRPLTVATFRLNYMLHELEPLGYHLVNVLLHSAVVYLYVLLCGAVFSQVWPALIAGLLFAVHPIHTEAVSGIVGRADIMCALFALISLFCYRNSLEKRANAQFSLFWLVLSLVGTLCAALCKEIGITTSLLCLAYQVTFRNNNKSPSAQQGVANSQEKQSSFHDILSALKECLPRATVLMLFSTSFLWARLKLNQGPPLFHVDNNPALGFPTPYRQLHWSYLCVVNVWLLLSPSQLCAEYAMGTIPPVSSLSDPRNLLTLTTFAGLLSLSSYAAASPTVTHHRKILFGLSLLILPYLPASNLFFPVGFVVAERVLYLPSMGFCLLISYGFHLLLTSTWKPITKNLRFLAKTLIIFLLVTQSLKTFSRNFEWSDNLTLFRSALRVSQTSAKMWNFVGNSYFKAGNNTLAEPYFRKSLEVESLFSPAHINLVRILKREKRFEEAIEHAELASEQVVQGMAGVNPHYYKDDRRVFLELARLLLLYSDRYEEALKWSQRAAGQFSDWEAAYEIMGKVLIKLGRHSGAKKALQKAVELKEEFPAAYFSLGEALSNLGELGEAEAHYRRAIALDGGKDTLQLFSLVKVIIDSTAAHTTERLTEALNTAFDILELEPENGNLTLAIALVYMHLGQSESSLEYIDRTREINPTYPSYCHDRGKLLFDLKRYKEADEMFAECERQGVVPSQSTLFTRGTNYLTMNDTERAREFLGRAFEMNASDLSTRVNYGIALIHSKLYTEALDIFKQLVADYPDNPSYSKQVSILESSLGQEQL